MRVLGFSLRARLSEVALLVMRVMVGIIMLAHGWQKFTVFGSVNFGSRLLAQSGVPLPIFMGYLSDLNRAYRRHTAHRGAVIAAGYLRAHYRPRRCDPSGEDLHRTHRVSGQ